LYLNLLKFIVSSVEGSEGSLNGGVITTGPAVFLWTRDKVVVKKAKYLSIDSSGVGFNNLNFVLIQRMLKP
jgi:hypothetical protein